MILAQGSQTEEERINQEEIETQEYPIEECEIGSKRTNEMISSRQDKQEDELYPGVSSQKKFKLQADKHFHNNLALQQENKQEKLPYVASDDLLHFHCNFNPMYACAPHR